MMSMSHMPISDDIFALVILFSIVTIVATLIVVRQVYRHMRGFYVKRVATLDDVKVGKDEAFVFNGSTFVRANYKNKRIEYIWNGRIVAAYVRLTPNITQKTSLVLYFEDKNKPDHYFWLEFDCVFKAVNIDQARIVY